MTATEVTLIVAVILLTSASQFGQKKAADAGSGFAAFISSKWLWLALACMGTALLLWFAVLQRVPVGIAYPLLSLNILAVTILARVAFNEQIGRRAWWGCLCIVLGAALLGGQA
ncbi:EamA family transporter [Pseudomonas oryzihabitans]|uniref:EamA family transporter n=1 Tax=Pseudomonas oryzihabitans TaxID=47885 RepID=UPI00119F4FE3|nr:EamA family transporter [Pseudomonas psychrotolerans]